MDELAEKIGMDPLEFRYLNVYRPGATTPTGQDPEVYSACPKCSTSCARSTKKPKQKAARESTPENKKGVGVSIGIYGCGLDGVDGAEADVELTKDGVTDLQHLAGSRPGRGYGHAGHGARRPAPAWALRRTKSSW